MVNIFGEEYPITGVTDPSHIARVADYVDSKMRDAAQLSRVNGRERVAILAAMSIASELFEVRDQLQEQDADAATQAESLLQRLNEALPQA
ncbi:MAG: cell division protein ZapA [bacterium]